MLFRLLEFVGVGLVLTLVQGQPAAGNRHAEEPTKSTKAARAPQASPTSRDELSTYLASPKHVRWQKAARLFLDGPESCVDGREFSNVVGTPGGDAGEFILSLSVIEQTTGHSFSAAEVANLMSRHLDAFGGFYLHSDEHAQAAVVAALRQSRHLTKGATADSLVRSPPAHLQERILDVLTHPSSIGCGHLRLMVTRSADYRVRPELVSHVLRAFFQNLWQQRPGTRFVVLAGEHHERAVINVHVAEPVHPFSPIPLVEPHDGAFEAFVYHPEVTEWLRREHAAFFMEHLPWLAQRLNASALETALIQRGREHLTLTIEALAAGLPQFDVVSTARGLEIREVTKVPQPPKPR